MSSVDSPDAPLPPLLMIPLGYRNNTMHSSGYGSDASTDKSLRHYLMDFPSKMKLKISVEIGNAVSCLVMLCSSKHRRECLKKGSCFSLSSLFANNFQTFELAHYTELTSGLSVEKVTNPIRIVDVMKGVDNSPIRQKILIKTTHFLLQIN